MRLQHALQLLLELGDLLLLQVQLRLLCLLVLLTGTLTQKLLLVSALTFERLLQHCLELLYARACVRDGSLR